MASTNVSCTSTTTSEESTEGRLIDVKPIYTSKEDLEALKMVVESRNMSQWAKDNKVRKVVGNRCVICGGISTQIATYDYIGATRIERYCDRCAQKQFSRSEQ